jgi:hypothetical protein
VLLFEGEKKLVIDKFYERVRFLFELLILCLWNDFSGCPSSWYEYYFASFSLRTNEDQLTSLPFLLLSYDCLFCLRFPSVQYAGIFFGGMYPIFSTLYIYIYICLILYTDNAYFTFLVL